MVGPFTWGMAENVSPNSLRAVFMNSCSPPNSSTISLWRRWNPFGRSFYSGFAATMATVFTKRLACHLTRIFVTVLAYLILAYLHSATWWSIAVVTIYSSTTEAIAARLYRAR